MQKTMKNIYFLKTVFTLILCGFFSLIQAQVTTIYLSATGNDSNNGLTAATAVKTFSKAHDLAVSGSTIIVRGMIDFSTDPAIVPTLPAGFSLTKNLIIQGGTIAADGFDGKALTQLIRSGGFNLSLSRLTIKGGSSSLTGGALLVTGGTITITDVVFDGNKSTGRGGAIAFEPATALTVNLRNTVFINNSTMMEGGAFLYADTAAPFANSITFTNCAFISNTAIATTAMTGGAGYINNNTATASLQLSFINSTIAKNQAGASSSGGLFIGNAQSNSNIVLTNCTVTDNSCLLAGSGGAGIRVASAVTGAGGKVKIYNCIIENNNYPGTAITLIGYNTDFAWQGEGFTPGTNLIIENTLLGKPGSSTNAKWAAANFPNSRINYVVSNGVDPVTNSYLAKLEAFDATTNSYALGSDSFALAYGLTTYLSTLVPSVTTDQLNFPRPSPACSAGSREKNPTGPALGLKKNFDSSIFVYRNANNLITVENSTNDFTGSITVYNTLGQVVAKTAAIKAITTIDKTLNAGVYIVMLNNAAGSSAKKVIIN
jgi:predicted outer membrane repeat protein